MLPFVNEDALPADVGNTLPSALSPIDGSGLRSGLPAVGEGLRPAIVASGARRRALPASLLAVPAAAGALYARATTRRRGLLGVGLAALGLGALQVELGRWFTSEPDFDAEGKVGDLELRHYEARVEARARVGDLVLEQAIDHAYGRLAGYICGENQTGELLARMTPILTTMNEGCYTVSLMMPPGRTIPGLPRPDHPGIELCKVPARQIAALRFRGRCTRDNIAAHERVLLRQLVNGGLVTRGSIAFVTFDSPATLPILRRNELWIELA